MSGIIRACQWLLPVVHVQTFAVCADVPAYQPCLPLRTEEAEDMHVDVEADANHLAALQQLVLGFADASASIRNAVADFFHHDSRLHHHTVSSRMFSCHFCLFNYSFLSSVSLSCRC